MAELTSHFVITAVPLVLVGQRFSATGAAPFVISSRIVHDIMLAALVARYQPG